MGDEVELYGERVVLTPAVGRPVDDAERERAIGWLRHHCGLGALTLDEFGDRAAAVYAAGSELELWAGLDGLDVPKAPPHQPAGGAAPAAVHRRGQRWHVAVFGGADRRGRWRLATRSVAVALFGGVDLDLRSVTLAEPEATEISITAVALFGGVEIVVPEGMDVEVDGLTLFGGKDCRLADVAPNRGLPVLHVRALVLFGGLDVRSKGPAVRSDRRAAKEVRRSARELRRHG